ncbi:MAG: sialate O-acetylesterase [Bacteroidota bacterium]
MIQHRITITLLFIFSGLSTVSFAQLSVASIFTDNVILQRDTEVPIWGWTEDKASVNVQFRGKTYLARTDKEGKWTTKLPSTAAGGPYEIKINQGNTFLELKNVLFGDVWVCSGQSNMEWTLENSMRFEEEKVNATDDQIRHFKVQRKGSDFPTEQLEGGPWEVNSSETVPDFTAVGYFFAKELRKEVGVPIGLLNSSWGGSRVEPWMSANALGYSDEQSAAEINQERIKEQATKKRKQLEELLGSIPEKDEGWGAGAAPWAAENYDDKEWKNMELPNLWEGQGLSGLDGIVWYRKQITLTPAEARDGLTLHLGRIDDSDWTWVNGNKVGEMEQKYNADRVYEVAAKYLKAGENVIAVRVDDTGGGGGMYGDEEGQISYTSVGNTKSLNGDWKYKVGQVYLEQLTGGRTNQTPMLLYNKMIYPILDFPIKGVIWYQGESNANSSDAFEYRKLFSDMIIDWRKNWNSGEFPFLFVQLANFMQVSKEPMESSWAMLRASQSATLKVPNTAQAVIIDIGEAKDIHPRNKHDVGYRLSLGARKLAYGEEKLVYSGPAYRKMERKGKKIILDFNHIGGGLVAKDGELKEFAIAGEDQKFVWAKAKIKGKKIVVWSNQVSKPVAVRYAWADNPDQANLYNKEGLPASPFRTDSW